MKKLIYLILSFGMIVSSCSNDELSEEPNGVILIDGERWELRCKVNGEDWFPASGAGNTYSGGLPFTVTYNGSTGGGFTIVAKQKDKTGNVISTIGPSGQNAMPNDFLEGYIGSTYFTNWQILDECKDFNLLKQSDLKLKIIDLDETNNRLKSTFSFNAYNECGDSVVITDGYLDAPYIN